jgi:glyoxylase I family protein
LYQIESFSFPEYKERASFPEAKGLRHLAFAVDDINTAVNKLTEHGVDVRESGQTGLRNKRFVFFMIQTGSRWNYMRNKNRNKE